MGRVARAYGQRWQQIYEAPWHDTLVAYYALDEMERIEQLRQQERDVDMAFSMNAAFHGGRPLTRLRHHLLARLQEPTAHDDTVPAPEALADDMMRLAERLNATRS